MRDISSTAMQYQGMHKDSEDGSPQSVRPGWARTALEEKAVRFDGDTVVIPDMVKLATFYDPDGNAWMLAQSLQ